jgi:hypothetical protein
MKQMLLPIYPDAGQALGGLGRTKIYQLIDSGKLRTVKSAGAGSCLPP